MSLFANLKQRLLGKRPLTADHRPPPTPAMAMRADEIPDFDLNTAELMRYDPQVRIGLGVRNGVLMQAQVDVIGPNAHENGWVQDQWNRIWSSSAHELLKAKLFGFLPCEVMYRQMQGGAYDGAVGFDRLEPRYPRDARPLTADGRVAGFSLKLRSGRVAKVLAPKGLVATFDAEFGNPFGRALLERAYPSWHEKWMAGGAKKLLRLRMVKDAYIGDVFWYPPDTEIQLADGRTLLWRDLAREIIDARSSGGAMTLPLLLDASGNKLLDYTPPQGVEGHTQMFQWKRDVDMDIWKALEVPPEVIEAFQRGSGYSGRAIPLMICLAAVQVELAELVRCIDRDILRPVAHLNFGRAPQYELRPRSLLETFGRSAPSAARRSTDADDKFSAERFVPELAAFD
ncbi:MAG: hypothetical protein KDA41_22830 [Planctomycetales bacterium]|nr:hypothetical protein [Planctomycetales bacterium]